MSTINNGWDVAYLLMHSSLDELGTAHSLCENTSDIEINSVPENECFFLAPKIEGVYTCVRKHLVKSVVLFQSGMEAIINWIQSIDTSIPKNGSFAEKWENAFKAKSSDYDFSPYKEFYKNYRVHIVHPDKEERFETINNLSFSEVYEGIKSGWLAFAALSEVTGNKHDNDSWKIICDAHQLPSSIDKSIYPNPQEIAQLLRLKHRKYLGKLKS